MTENPIDPANEWLAKNMFSTAEKYGQKRARQLLRDSRIESTRRKKARKEDLRTKIELGGEVVKAGLSSWAQDEVLGLLLDGRDRVSHSPTLRLALRKKGEAFRAGYAPTVPEQSPPPTTH